MKKKRHKAFTAILIFVFALYLIILFRLTLFRYPDSLFRSVNLVPFDTIALYLEFMCDGRIVLGIINLFGNFALLFPFGYIIAVLFPKMRNTIKILMLSLILSLIIEIGQYILACGSTDIDDLILNTIGGIVGYWTYALAFKPFKLKKSPVSTIA